MNTKFIKHLILASLIILLLAIPLIGVSCGEAEIPASSSTAELSATLVPNTDLDIYILIKQGSPTRIPKDLIGAPTDIGVESLAIWGIARGDDNYSIGGGLTLSNAADAAKIYPQIPKQAQMWTQLSERTIYFVQSLGDPAENLKAAISKHDFKPYNDRKALQEIALMPSGGSTKPVAIGIIKPNKALVNLMKKYADANIAGMIDTIFTWGRPEVITFGLYASQQIDVADIAQRVISNTIWEADLGVLVSVKSGLPGFIVSPIASRVLDNAGYPKINLGQLTVYKASLNTGTGKTIPALLDVEGNRIFAAVSGKESYAQTLLTSIKR